MTDAVYMVPFEEYADAEAIRMRLGLPVGCGVRVEDFKKLDAVTKKMLAEEATGAVE